MRYVLSDDLKTRTIRLLTRWGEWARSGSSRNLGYPKASAFVHAGEARETNADVLLTDEDAERVERVMSNIKREKPDIFDVLAAWYVFSCTTTQGAKKLHISFGTFRDTRRQGEALVQGVLFSREYQKSA